MNPYYSPGDLTLVGDIDIAGSYEFDIIAVWQDPTTNRILIASDSGCSCPDPFNGVTPEPVSKAEAIRRIRAHGQAECPDQTESLVQRIRSLPLASHLSGA